jgi:hypothetical protein
VFDVYGKLVKHVVLLLKLPNKKLEKYNKKIFTKAAEQANDQFLLSRNFRG